MDPRCEHGNDEETCETCLAGDIHDVLLPPMNMAELEKTLKELEETDPALKKLMAQMERDQWREERRKRWRGGH
jgi:hypothetical protein